MKMCK